MGLLRYGTNADGLKQAIGTIPELREEFWKNVNVLGSGDELNQALENAGRVADFLEFAELMCLDALHRNESCGGHFREEFQTPEGEALRDDDRLLLCRRLGISQGRTSTRSSQRTSEF